MSVYEYVIRANEAGNTHAIAPESAIDNPLSKARQLCEAYLPLELTEGMIMANHVENWVQRFETFLLNQTFHDHSHDLAHFRRVYALAQVIAQDETVNHCVIAAACYFHDIVSLPKDHPERAQSSRLAAAKTQEIFANEFPDFPAEWLPMVLHAIEAHSFSAKITPTTLEAKIVQDADRMESVGAMGIARTFYTSGLLKRALFCNDDPFAEHRDLDDQTFALDHFQAKLLKLPALMQTQRGRAMAQRNVEFMVTFMEKLGAEVQGDFEGRLHFSPCAEDQTTA